MKYSKIIGFIVIVLFVGSCSEFLEEEPRDAVTVDRYLLEAGQARSAVNYLYQNGVPQMFIGGGVFLGTRAMYLDYLTGFFTNEFSGQEIQVDLAQQLALTPSNVDGTLNGFWLTLYRGVLGANVVLDNIDRTAGLSDEERQNLRAQASFFRGFAYFYLVRIFGDVPLILNADFDTSEIFVSRSPVAAVYDQIVDDLTIAAAPGVLPEGSMVDNGYRITRETASMLLADVYLTMSGSPLSDDNYQNAASAARTVINSGAFSLSTNDVDDSGDILFEDSAYNKIRKEEAIGSEYIYQIEFVGSIRDSDYPKWSYPNSVSGSVGTRYGTIQNAFGPTDEFFAQYDTINDLRAQNKQYFHTTVTDRSGQDILDDDGNVITFPRAPYLWLDEEAFYTTTLSSKNFRVYSYSEALLVGAEAIALSEGVTAEAVDYLTQVRSRAYWTTDSEVIRAELSGLSTTAFVEEVWKERNRELVLDHKLWFDMIRTRKFPVANNGEVTFTNLIGAQNTFGRTFEEKHLLLPIAESEIQRNSSLTQNPGY